MSTLNLDRAPRELHLYELAMLSGGADLAIAAAAARLHGDGLLKAWVDGRLQTIGELPAGAHALEREVHATVRRAGGMPGAMLRSELADSPPVEAITTELMAAGLLAMSPRAPFGRRRLRTTRSGRRLVAGLRGERPELRWHPSSGEAARAIALFGGGSLWLVEPELASALALPREASRHRGGETAGAWGGWGFWDGGNRGGSCGGGHGGHGGHSGGCAGGGGGHGGSCGGGGGGGCGGGG